MVILEYIASFLAVMLVLPIHEFAHAFVADRCGDKTPRAYGRLTLNPLAHFDIYGVISMILIRFGWGKPVPINPNNFRHYKRDSFLVSIAGVVANLLTAFLIYPVVIFAIRWFNGLNIDNAFASNMLYVCSRALVYIHLISLSLSVFNLIPLYPLDGFKALDAIVTKKGKFFYFLYKNSRYILLGLLLISVLADVIPGLAMFDVLGFTLGYLVDELSGLIGMFWEMFF